jgi:hypothetical protein
MQRKSNRHPPTHRFSDGQGLGAVESPCQPQTSLGVGTAVLPAPVLRMLKRGSLWVFDLPADTPRVTSARVRELLLGTP